MNRKVVLACVAISVFAVLVVAWIFYSARKEKENGPNRNDAKLLLIQTMSSKVPPCSQCQKVDASQSSGATSAGITEVYRSTLSCDAIVRYYEPLLLSNGWSLFSDGTIPADWGRRTDRELNYRQAEYDVYLTYPKTPSSNNCEFTLEMVWGGRRP